jgi:hypothetical protein
MARDLEKADSSEPEYWLYRFYDQHEQFSLHTAVRSSFLNISDNVSPAICKDKFQCELRQFCAERLDPKVPAPTSDLTDLLFESAVTAHESIATWKAVTRKLKAPETQKAMKHMKTYFEKQIRRFSKVKRLLGQHLQTAPPESVRPWAQIWIKNFGNHADDIRGQLKAALDDLDRVSKIGRMGRTEAESHILLLAKHEIREHIRGTALERHLSIIVAAFAYAAQLVPFSDKPDSDFVQAVEMRLSRAKQAREVRKTIMTMLLAHRLMFSTDETARNGHPGG